MPSVDVSVTRDFQILDQRYRAGANLSVPEPMALILYSRFLADIPTPSQLTGGTLPSRPAFVDGQDPWAPVVPAVNVTAAASLTLHGVYHASGSTFSVAEDLACKLIAHGSVALSGGQSLSARGAAFLDNLQRPTPGANPAAY